MKPKQQIDHNAAGEEVKRALFTWTMAMRDKGSETADCLNVFRCGGHWYIGRKKF